MHVRRPILLVLLCLATVGAGLRLDADPRTVLRQVERAQSEYRTTHGRYTASPRALRMESTRGVQVRLVAEGGAGYSAVAIGAAEECAVFHGSADPPRSYARTAGRIACRSR